MQLDAEKFLACLMITGLVTAGGCARDHAEVEPTTGGESATTAEPETMEEEEGYAEPEEEYGAPAEAEPGYESEMEEPEPAPITE